MSAALRARAFWTVKPHAGEIREEVLPPLGAADLRIQTQYSAVSRGTESLVFRGNVPASEFARMRCPHQTGEFPGPVKYGYCNVGLVVEGRAELRGRSVFCLYPHQTQYVIPEQAVVLLPDSVPPARAVLAANMETALNALWDAQAQPGDRISVVGGGVLGCLSAYLAQQIPGAEVELVDVRSSRRQTAKALRVQFALPSAASCERDWVIHASATPEGLKTALDLCATESRVLELSWYGDTKVAIPLGEAFHARRLSIRASQVGALSPNARPRWDHKSRLALALKLCADPALDALVSEEGSFDELPETLARLADPETDVLCHRVVYPNQGPAAN